MEETCNHRQDRAVAEEATSTAEVTCEKIAVGRDREDVELIGDVVHRGDVALGDNLLVRNNR